jgi:glycosyltransferase involved in cell wall biosynthesis
MKVSVIIPSYNCAPYLSDAISSVINQTYINLEIIIVDDGSTDNTAEVIAPFRNNIKYLKQENQGVSAARNAGMRRATGDLIAFLDADDIWFPDKIAIQLDIFNRNPEIAGVFSDFGRCDKDGNQTEERFVTREYHIFNYYKYTWSQIFPNHNELTLEVNGTNTPLSMYHGNVFNNLYVGNFIKTSTFIIKREVMNTAGYFTPERRTQEDYEYWLKIASKFQLAYIDVPLMCTRRRPNQLTSKTEILDIVYQSLDVIETVGLKNINKLGKSVVYRRLTDKYRKLALVHISRGNSAKARECLKNSIKWRPFEPQNIFLLILSYIPSKLVEGTYKLLKRNYDQ